MTKSRPTLLVVFSRALHVQTAECGAANRELCQGGRHSVCSRTLLGRPPECSYPSCSLPVPLCLFLLALLSLFPGGVLRLLDHGEEYVFTLPSAYARSILTVPWVELGGKVNISCAKTGYSATVTFHTKPFYGGKVHR